MSARASFSHDSRLVKMPLPNTVLLKDYLLDDLSSCSSNGFRSYPRRQCCTKVRYLIEIDLNKHIKLAPSHKQLLKKKSKLKQKPKLKLKMKLKSKSSRVLHKASTAVVNVFKKFQFSSSGSGAGNRTKPNFLQKNLSRKLSKHGFWKRTNDDVTKEFKRLNSFDESSIKQKENILHPASKASTPKSSSSSNSNSNRRSNSNSSTFSIKHKENILPPSSKASAAVTANSSNSNSNSNSNSSTESYFTTTSKSSTTGGCSKMNVALHNIKETNTEQLAMEKMNTVNGENVVAVTTVTATSTTTNAKKKLQGEEKDMFSPISVIDFPCDRENDEEEDEVTSPFHHSPFYVKGCKRKLMSKVQRTKSLARLNPVRLEDRITLSESRTHGWILESSLQIQRELAAEKKAIAFLQQLKATMSSHDLLESALTERVLLEFFRERFIEGSVSNYIILQEAKDWINGQTKDMFECQNNKLTYVKEMEKEGKWLKYNKEKTREVVLELEFEVFTSLVEEMLLECYL